MFGTGAARAASPHRPIDLVAATGTDVRLMPIDLTEVNYIDMHVHVEDDTHGNHSSVDEIAEYYRSRSLAAVVFTVDAHTALGRPALSGAEIVARAAAHDDVLIPFASVDPHDGSSAVALLRELAAAGARGLKLHPSLQNFAPNDVAHYQLYEAAAELGLVLLVHTGSTGIGAGQPGGRGIRLRYGDPMLLDDVAADFPELTMVLAHPSVPWQDAAIAVATHKANVYLDLSGWSPRYFPVSLVRAAGGRLRHKVLFGSDYPVVTPDHWLRDFVALGIGAEARALILKENAVRVLGLTDA